MSFSLFSNSLLEEFQECWSSMEAPLPAPLDVSLPYSALGLFAFFLLVCEPQGRWQIHQKFTIADDDLQGVASDSNGLCPPPWDEPAHFPLNDSDWPHDTINPQWGDTNMDHDSQVFEFFNLQDAALNPHSLHNSQLKLKLDGPSASASRTLYSPTAHYATLNVPSASASRTLYSPTAHHVLPDIPIGLIHANLPESMKSQLQHWYSCTRDLVCDVSFEL